MYFLAPKARVILLILLFAKDLKLVPYSQAVPPARLHHFLSVSTGFLALVLLCGSGTRQAGWQTVAWVGVGGGSALVLEGRVDEEQTAREAKEC